MRSTIVVISGPKEHGKSTLASLLETSLSQMGVPVSRTKFALGVYQAAAAFTGDDIFLREPERAKRMRFHVGEKTQDVTGTQVLQLAGTECGREVFGKDTWLRAVIRRAERQEDGILLVDDCRFPNEAEIADFRIWLEAPGVTSDQNQAHESEKYLPSLRSGANLVLVRAGADYFQSSSPDTENPTNTLAIAQTILDKHRGRVLH